MKPFRRYQSTIHGNYRKAYLRCGAMTGLLMVAYAIVRLLMGSPMSSPVSYIVDAVLIVAVFLFTAYYRAALPDKRITFKEAVLFGIGLSFVAAFVYAIALGVVGLLSPQQTVLFTVTMTPNEITLQDPQMHYWAFWWAIVAFVEVALLGSFAAFIAAICFRNEKPPLHQKDKE